jgi:diguanylate cyclase (GGDEF)-like protein/PAS domain S-box-containing protein
MPIVDDENTVTGYHVLSIDITEKIIMSQIIENEKERYRTTLLSVGDGVISTDNQRNITVMNPVAETLTGWTQDKAIGRRLSDVFVIKEWSRRAGESPVKAVLETATSMQSMDPITLVSASGVSIPIVNNAAPIISNSGQITGTVIVFRDFSEYIERQQQIEFLSFCDPLTGLYNRRYMEEAIVKEDRAENLPLTVMILDVNGLKLTNDAFGHKAGDELLKAVADILRSVCRAGDICARMGGDEFFILLLRTDENKAEKIKQKLIRASTKTKLDTVVVSLAIGYSVKRSMNENIDHIIIDADNQMYREKLKFGKTMRNETIETVLRNINFKYDREQIHTERVSQYCEAIAVEMGLSEKEVSDIKIAGSLHDIGKNNDPSRAFKQTRETHGRRICDCKKASGNRLSDTKIGGRVCLTGKISALSS